MCNDFFDGPFDFDNNGELDDFEKRAQFDAFLNCIKEDKGIEKSLDEMSDDEFCNLVADSGIDPSGFGI